MSLPAGSRLGPYEITTLLGVGGMGEVYRARDTRLNRIVAIKILPARVATTPGFRERFAREARAISAVEHPHICPLYDIGTEDGVDFLVMQYLEGETLAERIGRGPIPVPEALTLARQIAAGLEAAHERGILHRDLKPSNIKLTPDGKAKILDFGLAKTLTAVTPAGESPASPTPVTALTESGVIVGSAGYMSPEQSLGGDVDRRADIWAFGCVLFEMLAGRRAFNGGIVTQVLAAVVGQEPDWAALPADTPRRLRVLLRRCLQKDPARRLRDVGDARLELEEADPAETDSPAVEKAEPARRRSAIVAWSIAGAATVIAAGLLMTRPPGHRGGGTAMRFSAVTTFSGVEAQPALSPDGRSVAFVSNRDGRWDIYVGLVAGGTVVRITNDPNVETRPRWSPDGARILFARLNETGLHDVWVVSALGGIARRVVPNGSNPAWSPDGRSIAYSSGGAIWICGADGENPRAVTRPELPIVHFQPSFSHDGRRIAFVRRTDGPYGELAIVDLQTGTVRDHTHDRALAWSPAWSPDDEFIYFTSSRGGAMNIWKIPSASGESEQITAGQGADTDIDLSADGTRLVFSSFRINLNLAELSLEPGSLGRRNWLTNDASRSELAPRYSPDGRRIAYFSNRSGAEREGIWVMDADGASPSKLVENDDINVFPRWAADGKQLVFDFRARAVLDSQQLRWVLLAGGAPQELPIRPWRAPWGDVAADGRLIYQTSQDAGELYDLRTQQRQPIADLPGEPMWSRDGRTFAYVVRPGLGKPSDSGLWTGTLGGARKQVFQGWVVSFAWAGASGMAVLEGKPDFKGILWHVDDAGRRRILLTDVGLYRRETDTGVSPTRFDVHPDGRRIVIEAIESLESDIGLIDNVR